MSSNTENLNLYKADPVADKKNTFNIKAMLNDNWDKVDADSKAKDDKITKIIDELKTGATMNPSVGYGMNSKITIPEGGTSVQPSFTFNGAHKINLFGSQQYYKNIANWSTDRVTPSLDINNKLYGSSSVKITSTTVSGDGAGAKIALPSVIDTTNKNYIFSIYLKNGNAPGGIELVPSNETDYWYSSGKITNTTEFTRVAFKVGKMSAKLTYLHIYLRGVTAVGQYGYVDGIQIEEITDAQCNDPNYVPTPYHDSYSCLTNPYVEIHHNNLVRNGNCEEGLSYWIKRGTDCMTIVDNKFQIIPITQGTDYYYQVIHVKPYTHYTLSSNVSGNGVVNVFTYNQPNIAGSLLVGNNGTFDTGIYDAIVVIIGTSVVGVGTADSIMLVEGTTAPTEYKHCKIERVVLEGDFADGDEVTYQSGRLTGQKNWIHPSPLYGKDYPWKYYTDYPGYKAISVAVDDPLSWRERIITKYDGKLILNNSVNVVDSSGLDMGSNLLVISVADSDSGWLDSINPNDDEVKAFMNGWKALWNNGGRYICWCSIVSYMSQAIYTDVNAFPKGSATTLASPVTNSATINVVDINMLNVKVGDKVAIIGITSPLSILGISGNSITLDTTIGTTINAGQVVAKADISILNYCANNVAPNYEGYQLHAKLQNPVPLTDQNCRVVGDALTLTEGENYVYADAGQVIGEVANPQYDGVSVYYINDIYPSPVNMPSSILQFKTEYIEAIYKNMVVDTAWVFTANHTAEWSYGNALAYISASSYDNKASYTVDYKILATIAPTIGSIVCQYNTAVFEAINELGEAVKSRQMHDSALDNIVDLSMYEVMDLPANFYPAWALWDNVLYINLFFKFSVRKNQVPRIGYNNLSVSIGPSGEIANKFTLAAMDITKEYITLRFATTDSYAVNNIKTYGAPIAGIKITADCR